MQLNETQSDGLKKEFKIVIPNTEFETAVDDKLKEIAKTAILLLSLLIDFRLDKFGFSIFTYSMTICSIFSYCFLRSSADSGLSEISYFLSELTSLKVQCITPLVSYL